jgi:hypothetical protein
VAPDDLHNGKAGLTALDVHEITRLDLHIWRTSKRPFGSHPVTDPRPKTVASCGDFCEARS